jgi:hypothetical protein
MQQNVFVLRNIGVYDDEADVFLGVATSLANALQYVERNKSQLDLEDSPLRRGVGFRIEETVLDVLGDGVPGQVAKYYNWRGELVDKLK